MSDLTARVRGYARHLAVVAVAPHILYGVYRLPTKLNPSQATYVHAAIDRNGELGDLSTLHLTHDAMPPSMYESPTGLSISASREQDKPGSFMIFNRYYDDPILDEETISLHMAQKMLSWLRHFDVMIPELEASVATANAIEARESLYDHLGEMNSGKKLF